MKSKLIKFLALISLFATFACTGVIHDGLWPLRKGLASKEVIKIVDKNGKTSITTVNHRELTKVTINADKQSNYSIMIGKKFLHFENQLYAYAFKNDSLIYWGTPIEFARHSSPVINELGEATIELFEKN